MQYKEQMSWQAQHLLGRQAQVQKKEAVDTTYALETVPHATEAEREPQGEGVGDGRSQPGPDGPRC